MDKRNSNRWIGENISDLITTKLLMKSLLQHLEKLLENSGIDAKHRNTITEQLERRQSLERLARIGFSNPSRSTTARCDGTPYIARKERETISLSTSPITPYRPTEKLGIWDNKLVEGSNSPGPAFSPARGCADRGVVVSTTKIGESAKPVANRTNPSDATREKNARRTTADIEVQNCNIPCDSCKAKKSSMTPGGNEVASEVRCEAQLDPCCALVETSVRKTEDEEKPVDVVNTTDDEMES